MGLNIKLKKGNEYISCGGITHNLTDMGAIAGIYSAIWRPYRYHKDYQEFKDYDKECEFEDSVDIQANIVIGDIQEGLIKLLEMPSYFKQFEPDNDYGNYEGFVNFVKLYLTKLEENPNAIIKVDR